MTDEKTPPAPEFQPGMMANLLSKITYQHAEQLDRVAEQLLVAHFGSLEQAIARAAEYDLVFDNPNFEMLWTVSDTIDHRDTVAVRITEVVRLEMKPVQK